MTQVPYTLPLTREAFTSAVHKGLGRAMQHARLHGIAGLEDVLVDALLHCRVYDTQIDELRTAWLLEIARVGGAERAVESIVLPRLTEPIAERCDRYQRAATAKELASRGIEPARHFLNEMLTESVRNGETTGALEIMELDGANGLIRVASELAGRLAARGDCDDNEWILDHIDDSHGKGAARRVLAGAAETSGEIARLVRFVEEQESTRKARRKAARAAAKALPASIDESFAAERRLAIADVKALSAESIIAQIEGRQAHRGRYHFNLWGRHAPVHERLCILDHLKVESDPKRIVLCLQVFMTNPLPSLDDVFLTMARHGDWTVQRDACTVLALYSDERIRHIALELLETGGGTGRAVELLLRNYRDGDHKLILEWLPKLADLDYFHWELMGLDRLMAAHPCPAAREAAIYSYQENPCGNCRARAVKRLRMPELGGVPEWMVAECADDGCDAVRDALTSETLAPD